MGGEGAMMAANNSLKNNRSLVSKRKERNALSGSYSNVTIKEFPNATPERLSKIKKRLQEENRKNLIKQLSVFVIIFFALVYFIYYLLF